jgi:hypothetical protein
VYVDVTGPTELEVAGVLFPAALIAVTLQVMFAPFCVKVKVNTFAVAFAIAVALALHWYAKDVGEKFQVPVVEVKFEPTVVEPETTGATVFVGGGVTFATAQTLFA